MLKYCLQICLVFLCFQTFTSCFQLLPPLNGSHEITSDNFAKVLQSKTIYLDWTFASRRDSQGLSQIPPSALEFAETFRDDLDELTNSTWTLQQVDNFPSNVSGIRLGAYQGKAEDLSYENGIATEEGYELDVQEGGSIFIGGAGARGMWWGTRSLLQQIAFAKLSTFVLPSGRSLDAPAYATRGFMLDAGRKWYSPIFLKDLCTYASFFKLSEFHYHSADNYPLNRGHNETWNEVYSQFAVRPQNASLYGLVQRENETLSAADFEDLQKHCAKRGITVILEIEAPGHALSITKWKPELALPTTKDLLNLTHPDTIPLVKSIWADFLPRIHSREVHIGADEYDAELADDYIRFVNEMAEFINATSGKRTRIWGTYEPSPTNLTISKDIIIQHWQYGQSDPVQLVEDGYEIINSDDRWAYMSLKNDHVPISPAPYPQFFNETRVLHFAGQQNVQWDPSYVNSVNSSMQLPPGAQNNKGAIFAAWNDNGPDATTELEAYYAIRRGIPLVAARAWTGSRGPMIDVADLDQTIDYLATEIPAANLERTISSSTVPVNGIPLISWNRDSATNFSHIQLGYGSKGMNYTLSLLATGPFNLSSFDVNLSLNFLPSNTTESNSTVFLTFTTSDNWQYPLRSTSYKDSTYFPSSPGQGRIWASPPGNQSTSSHEPVSLPPPSNIAPMNITITTDVLRGSRCWINDKFVGRFEVLVFGGHNTLLSWSQMAFVAPVHSIEGEGLQALQLWDQIIEPGKQNGSSTSPAPYQNDSKQLSSSWNNMLILLLLFVATFAHV